MQKPPSFMGMYHVALRIKNFTECVCFYTQLLGMKIVWQPDKDNIYLSSGKDNVALHRAPPEDEPSDHYQRLDHIGFLVAAYEAVDSWYDYLVAHNVKTHGPPKNHRDKTRSFYCRDPDGNNIQIIYIPSFS